VFFTSEKGSPKLGLLLKSIKKLSNVSTRPIGKNSTNLATLFEKNANLFAENCDYNNDPQPFIRNTLKRIPDVFPQLIDANGVVTSESLLAASGMDVVSEVPGELSDGAVLYIDPNDPQAAALLQQAGTIFAATKSPK
jgi:hypothetical protein